MGSNQIDWTSALEVEERFNQFHEDNPHVLEKIVTMISDMVRHRGRRAIGMKMVFEVLRWDHFLTTTSLDEFKLNNNYAPYYTRLVEKVRPDLVGVITKRRAAADNQL